ncbi:MAG: prepilin-type N-terminal cleavage/methylation domain-containing protein, partial [Clostridia bacterium]|nr:prepilin-type N-terminal cleavage/methylation domain-containing protein [Clostridia bacterium]
MLSKLTKMFKSQKGFTLVELMTVLIILAIVLAIGIPKYLQLQAKSGWEADADTIDNIAKAAETYAASINQYDESVTIKTLIDYKLIDGNLELNRKNDEHNVSVKNKGEAATAKKISDYGTTVKFSFNEYTGNVNNRASAIQYMIGNPPYGTGP